MNQNCSIAEQVSKSKAVVIIPAAGLASRMQSGILKPFIEIDGKTVLDHVIEAFIDLPQVVSIIILANPEQIDQYSKFISIKDPRIEIVAGGITRQHSVCLGLNHFKTKFLDTKNEVSGKCFAIIHDAARCLIKKELIQHAFTAAESQKAVTLAVAVSDSLIRVKEEGDSEQCSLKILEKIDRKSIYALQTPQIFSFDLIYERHSYFQQKSYYDFTDDTALLEGFHDVYLVEGDKNNIKITTSDDLEIAKRILRK